MNNQQSAQQPETQQEDLIELCSWLAHLVTQYHDLRYEALALPPDQCREHLMMKFPVVQGIRLQGRLRDLGAKGWTDAALGRALALASAQNQDPASSPEVSNGH